VHCNIWNKLNSHAPALISGQQLPKLFQAQFLLVDFKRLTGHVHRPGSGAAFFLVFGLDVFGGSTQHTTSGNALITSGAVFDLR
jgi:hypothetical protein